MAKPISDTVNLLIIEEYAFMSDISKKIGKKVGSKHHGSRVAIVQKTPEPSPGKFSKKGLCQQSAGA